jgi:hypothetical protein
MPGEEIGCTHSDLWEQTAMQHYFQTEQEQEARAENRGKNAPTEQHVSVFVRVPMTVIQSIYREDDHDFCERFWRPGHFSAHLCGMDKQTRLRLLHEVIAQADATQPGA